jgi:hypothetical protein
VSELNHDVVVKSCGLEFNIYFLQRSCGLRNIIFIGMMWEQNVNTSLKQVGAGPTIAFAKMRDPADEGNRSMMGRCGAPTSGRDFSRKKNGDLRLRVAQKQSEHLHRVQAVAEGRAKDLTRSVMERQNVSTPDRQHLRHLQESHLRDYDAKH